MMNQVALEDAQLVDRTEIPGLEFPQEDVLEDDEERRHRSRLIHRATSLGNLEMKKVNVIFMDATGYKRVNTTIWIQVGEYILLKDRVKLPVNRIVTVVID